MSKLKKGYIQVYTGSGKGKTTAALGLALRAIGQGLRVALIQFMKGKLNYGELKALRHFSGCLLEQFGTSEFIEPAKLELNDINLAQQGLKRAKEVIKSNTDDIVILDEINLAAAWKLVEENQVLEILKHKPANMEIILTGREAPAAFIEIADLVTEMKEIKHYFDKQGIPGRPGIEY
jgi:cob(I)alamin adenosyltransferase